MKESIIKEKSFEFALNTISLYKKLKVENEYIISKQVLRSGTSIGANVEEALAGQSKNKMSISSKEARETNYWLKLLKKSNLTTINVDKELNDSKELIRILTSIVKTSQQNLTQN